MNLRPVKADSEYDARELAMGVEVEKEHTTDEALAKKIAKHHLDEIGDYYTRLREMEGRAKRTFKCVPHCGKCCSWGGHVWVSDDDIKRIRKATELDDDLFLHSKDELKITGGACMFLGANGKCKIYDARPEQCRDFPYWDDLTIDDDKWNHYADKCPGMNKI